MKEKIKQIICELFFFLEICLKQNQNECKIKNNCTQTQTNETTTKETIEKLKNELKQETMNMLINWDDLEPFCGFKSKEKKHILIVDDNGTVTNLIEQDINAVLTKKINKAVDIEVIENIEKVKLTIKDCEIIKVVDNLAPYKIKKTCEPINLDECTIDYAVVDIVFGESVVKDGEVFVMDGIDLVAYLHKKNPNIRTCLFTGCFLDDKFSNEKDKIIKLLGKDYLENNVLDKTPYYIDRLNFLSTKLFNNKE